MLVPSQPLEPLAQVPLEETAPHPVVLQHKAVDAEPLGQPRNLGGAAEVEVEWAAGVGTALSTLEPHAPDGALPTRPRRKGIAAKTAQGVTPLSGEPPLPVRHGPAARTSSCQLAADVHIAEARTPSVAANCDPHDCSHRMDLQEYAARPR